MAMYIFMYCSRFYVPCFVVIPSIQSPINDQVRNQSEDTNFVCESVGEPLPDINWYFNGVMIAGSSKYMIVSKSLNITTTENTLTVYGITSPDAGTYTCSSSNIIGSVTSSGILTVTSKFYHVDFLLLLYITIIIPIGIATLSPLNNTIVREGNTTTITCEALGYPPPTVVWSRTDGNLSDRVSVSDSDSVLTGYGNVTRVSVNLTITNASREDTGVYMCSASNEIGSDDNNVNITVQCKFYF